MDNMALLVTVFCLLVCLQPATQQVLTPGAECGGKKKNMCPSGTMCQLVDSWDRYHCRKLVGQKCSRSDPYYYCEEKSGCDRKRNICTIGWDGDCSGKHKTFCMTGYSCDASFRCRTRVKGSCSVRYFTCGVGNTCKNRECTCIPGLWKRKRDVCVPAAGKVGGKCLENNVCTSPHSQCNSTTNRCECTSKYVRSSSDFSCKSTVGGNCTNTDGCTPDAICDPSDNICRLRPGESCAGDRANLCQNGKPCIDNLCRNKVGETCREVFYPKLCEPPSNCLYKDRSHVCGLESYKDCSKHPDGCAHKSTFCDPKLLHCQKKISESCFWDTACSYGAVCQRWFCKCLPGGKWNATSEVCEAPEGKVGGKCREGKKCDDTSARCTADGVCKCRKGSVTDNHYLTCNMQGPRCKVTKYGAVETFFGETIGVGLPCRFKLAKFRCASTVVEVSADKFYSRRLHNTYIGAVNITITGLTKNGNRTTNFFSIEYPRVAQYMRQNKTKGSAWRVTPGQDPPVKDDYVRLSTSASSGASILLRKLMKITYNPPLLTETVNVFYGEVLVQCAQKTFKSLEKFPVSLCGRPEDKAEGTYSNYTERVEKRLKREVGPDAFASMSRKAFSAVRLADRSILLEQTVSQRNAYCEEASTIVKGECPVLQTKLYNCSNMYDSNVSTYDNKASYSRCADKAFVDPRKLFVSCLNVLCDRLEGNRKNFTCQTLQTASDRCDDLENTQSPSDLMALANCTTP